MSSEENKEIAKRTTQPSSLATRYQPADFNGMWRMAKMVVSSGLAPDSIRKPEDAMVVMMQGAELGLTAMASLRSIHVIKGKPSLSAKLQVALARQLPHCEYFNLIEWTDKKATFEAKRTGGKPVKYTFTIDDAKRAGLIKKGGNWDKYPKNMAWSRAASHLASAEFPELLSGLYTPDEAYHIGEAEVVAPTDTRDLNARFSEPADDDAVDAEFEEPETGDDSDDTNAEDGQGIIV